MLGQIERYSIDTPTVGVIKSGDDLYDFHIKAWRSKYAPSVGEAVEFEVKNNKVTKVKPHIIYPENKQPVKSRIVAGILGLLLGGIGAHRIYLGFYGIALLQCLITLASGGFGLLWGFIEGFLILTSNLNKDAEGRDLK